MERATTAKEHASLPTPVAAVAGNMLPLIVSQTGSKCGRRTTVVKDSTFRLKPSSQYEVGTAYCEHPGR